MNKPERKPLPGTRASHTARFQIAHQVDASADRVVVLEAALREACELGLAINKRMRDFAVDDSEEINGKRFNDLLKLTEPNPDQTLRSELMKFYFTVGLYADGSPGEVFVRADKQGSLAAGALDACAILTSIALQHGVPLHAITEKLKGMQFEPRGFTRDPKVPSCTSPVDLLARWLETHWPPEKK